MWKNSSVLINLTNRVDPEMPKARPTLLESAGDEFTTRIKSLLDISCSLIVRGLRAGAIKSTHVV